MKRELPVREPKTYRFTRYTIQTLDRLVELYGTNRTAIIELAIAYFDQMQKRGV